MSLTLTAPKASNDHSVSSELALVMRWDQKVITDMLFLLVSPFSPPFSFTMNLQPIHLKLWLFLGGRVEDEAAKAAHVWIHFLTVVTFQALLKTAHKQRRRAKDAYRGSKCIWSKAQVLLEETAVHSGESWALCWFITLLDLVTEIRTSMFQSDSWPLRFTHPTANTPTVAAVFKLTCILKREENNNKVTPINVGS